MDLGVVNRAAEQDGLKVVFPHITLKVGNSIHEAR